MNEKDLASAGEGLREFYITPQYLELMIGRAASWSDEHIKGQIILFRQTLGGYPEVLEILEGELHKRNLNRLYRHIRRNPNADLQALLKKYGSEPDFREIIETEQELRGGVRHLKDASGET